MGAVPGMFKLFPNHAVGGRMAFFQRGTAFEAEHINLYIWTEFNAQILLKHVEESGWLLPKNQGLCFYVPPEYEKFRSDDRNFEDNPGGSLNPKTWIAVSIFFAIILLYSHIPYITLYVSGVS